MMYTKLKRPLPGKDRREKRERIHKTITSLDPLCPSDKSIAGLTPGNKKTGVVGTEFSAIWVWNLPPFMTCPGASEWCPLNCYNLDDRTDVYPIDDWRINLWLFLNEERKLQERIETQLQNSKEPCAVRIHSSGDFFSNDYIKFWKKIISDFRHITFWTYTRSWVVDELSDSIRQLNEMSNLSLFASYDLSMKKECPNYPRSLVFDTIDEMLCYQENFGGMICPEQFKLVGCCADCGLCMEKRNSDILFLLH